MDDSVGLLVSAIGLVLVPVCLARLVLGRADLAALYRAPGGDGWPRGVQEGDCPKWRLAETGPSGSPLAERQAIVGREIANPSPGFAVDGSTLEPGPRGVPGPGGDAVRAFVQPPVIVHGRVGVAGRRASAT
jgi:hypothetical protein